jgi:hypothetical protein
LRAAASIARAPSLEHRMRSGRANLTGPNVHVDRWVSRHRPAMNRFGRPAVLGHVTSILVFSLASAFSLAPAPSADDAAQSKDPAAAASETPTPTRRFVYEDDPLEGEVLRAGGVQITARTGKPHPPLIRIRGEFLDHLAKMSRDM